MVAELLFFLETDAVVTESAAAVAVHAGRVELALGCVLGDVGDGDADAAGETDLGTCVCCHWVATFLPSAGACLRCCFCSGLAGGPSLRSGGSGPGTVPGYARGIEGGVGAWVKEGGS